MSRLLAILLALGAAWLPAAAQEMYAAPAPTEVATWERPALPEDWDTVHGVYLRLHGDPADYPVLLALTRHGAASLPRLATELGVPIGGTVHVVLAPTRTSFWELQPGQAPSWADGVAYPALDTIYLHAPRARDSTGTPLERVLDHELVHVLLGRAFYPHRVPLWLQEGLARVAADEDGPQDVAILARGTAGSGLIALTALDQRFPADPARARLAYAQSADFVRFLHAEYGPEAVPRLVRSLARGETIDAAVHQATGAWLDEVDQRWRARFRTGIPLSWTVLGADGLLLGLGGIALVVGGVLRRRRFHQRLAEMAATEAVVDELIDRMRAERAEPGPAPDLT